MHEPHPLRTRHRIKSGLVRCYSLLVRLTYRAAWVLGLFALVGCYHPPSENQLIQTFESHRAEFHRLLEMASCDSKFRRIDSGEIPPRGMSVGRYDDYRGLFRKLGIENGLTWNISHLPGTLFFIASSGVPIGGTSRAIGYVYSDHLPLTPSLKNLGFPKLPMDIHSGHGQRTVYRHIQDHWYLFYDEGW